eukprot:scaffold44192_cov55-Cyclotella_meneghiniana.AAC.4
MGVLLSVQAYHNSRTVPMSHHIYNEWHTAYHNSRTVPMSHHKHNTAAGLFQCLITSMMNGEA